MTKFSANDKAPPPRNLLYWKRLEQEVELLRTERSAIERSEVLVKENATLHAQLQENEIRISALIEQSASLKVCLAESRANDRCAMQYLQQIREITGHGGDFPSLIELIKTSYAKDAE